jgi:predicted Rossmann-fold nucleotide-binding protein
MIGIVSSAALEAGGYVHGIIPKSLVERASETGGAQSQEGQGGDLLDKEKEYEGRFTTEVTGGMHEVSPISRNSMSAGGEAGY